MCAALVALCLIMLPAAGAVARTTNLRPQTEAPRLPSPLLLLVSIKKQRIRAFDASGQVTESRISSGQPGFDTPTGVFSVLEKSEYHESNIYEGAPMPFMQRLTWSGIALHAGVVPGYRASHGCIRLPASFAKSLFGITNVGNRVIVTPDETEPIAFNHPNLFKPLPAETPQASGARPAADPTKVASNDATADALAEMPNFLGVSPALAEAVRDPDAFAPDKPRSRAEADRKYITQMNKLQSAVRAAEVQKLAAVDKAKTAVRDADAAASGLSAAKQALDPARTAIVAADKKLAEVRRTFETYMDAAAEPASGNKAGARPDAASDEREADLEEAILDSAVEASTSRADLARRELDIAAAQGRATAAEGARQTALEDVKQATAQLKSSQDELAEANKRSVKRGKSVSVFVSLKTEHIYVRLGQEPLLEAPITVASPGKRVGTHVFTAMGYASNPDAFDWRLVSAHLPDAAAADDDDDAPRKGKRREGSLPLTQDASTRLARAALDSIKIPDDILDTITQLARPGASFIISDRELNASENGIGTEFVLLTR